MSDDGAIPENESDYADSGPFCIHWSEPDNCNQLCVCGHPCHHFDDCECGCVENRDPGAIT